MDGETGLFGPWLQMLTSGFPHCCGKWSNNKDKSELLQSTYVNKFFVESFFQILNKGCFALEVFEKNKVLNSHSVPGCESSFHTSRDRQLALKQHKCLKLVSNLKVTAIVAFSIQEDKTHLSIN